MRLVSYAGGFGRVEGDTVVAMGRDLGAYLRGEAAREDGLLPWAGLELQAPMPRPEKIIAVGLNYRDHALEAGAEVPPEPVLFPKFSNSVIGPGAPIVVPRATVQPDYEAELGVVIGSQARRVGVGTALNHVAGYMCVNDVSARDLQHKTSQWMRGKAVDTFLPCGPWLVTTDEIDDPQALGIRSFVNGEVRQNSSTAQMIWGVAELVSFISQTMTLNPGDIICTGTPPGVGVARKPPVFLAEGDLVEIEIDGLGRLSNPVVIE